MRDLVLFAAMSLDGYLAKSDHSMDWLVGDQGEHSLPDDRYSEFYETTDPLIMGSITYEEITRRLSPNIWPYIGKKSYILSSQLRHSSDPNIIFSDN